MGPDYVVSDCSGMGLPLFEAGSSSLLAVTLASLVSRRRTRTLADLPVKCLIYIFSTSDSHSLLYCHPRLGSCAKEKPIENSEDTNSI